MRTILLACVAVGALALSGPAAADTGYLTVEGTKSGKIVGEVDKGANAGAMEVVDLSYGIKSPRDAATGVVVGRRQSTPVTFTLRWSKASPQLFNSLVTNETLKTVEFKVFRFVPQTATTVHARTIKLTNARVSSFDIEDRNGDADNLEPLVKVGFVYQKIEITEEAGAITAQDEWSSPQ